MSSSLVDGANPKKIHCEIHVRSKRSRVVHCRCKACPHHNRKRVTSFDMHLAAVTKHTGLAFTSTTSAGTADTGLSTQNLRPTQEYPGLQVNAGDLSPIKKRPVDAEAASAPLATEEVCRQPAVDGLRSGHPETLDTLRRVDAEHHAQKGQKCSRT